MKKKKPKKYYQCVACGHAIYYSKSLGWRCGPGCDKAIKGKEIKK
jgi:lipopolysaccharide biosynthesis regulator YciM